MKIKNKNKIFYKIINEVDPMPLKCYTRERNDGTKYINCKGNENNKSKKNVSNNKMPTTPRKKPGQKPIRPKTPVKKRPTTPPKTKLQQLHALIPEGVPPEVLKTLPPAKTEKNKKFLSYVTDNRSIRFKEGATKKGKASERFNKYKSAKTVVQMLRKGGTFYDFINDVEKGIIILEPKKKPVVQGKVTLKPGMKLTKSKLQQQEMLDKGKVTIKKNKKKALIRGEAI